jgi:UPF0042 nucleotide-binding protein
MSLDHTRPRDEPPSVGHHILVLSGMSGSGKSTALRALEDVGYFCIDNLPVDLLDKLVDLGQLGAGPRRVALVMDAREGQRLVELPRVFAAVRGREGVDAAIIFFDADDDALARRFSETRRRHPLSPSGSVVDGIVRERERLMELRQIADEVIDTTDLTVHELRALVQERFGPPGHGELSVNVVSFGFRYGLPPDADLVFDVRFLPNPHFDPNLRDFRGTDEIISNFVLDRDETRELLRRVGDLLTFLVPRYQDEGKSYLTVAIGCTGGKHRSVAVSRAVGELLSNLGVAVKLRDRDINKR